MNRFCSLKNLGGRDPRDLWAYRVAATYWSPCLVVLCLWFFLLFPLSPQQSHNQWESVQLGSDDKETAKFRRLMGISKSSDLFFITKPVCSLEWLIEISFLCLCVCLSVHRAHSTDPTSATSSSANKEAQEEHSKRMNVLEYQYESSRYQTHIARGVGLGYGSAALTTELPSQKDSGDKLDEKL